MVPALVVKGESGTAEFPCGGGAGVCRSRAFKLEALMRQVLQYYYRSCSAIHSRSGTDFAPKPKQSLDVRQDKTRQWLFIAPVTTFSNNELS